MAKQTNAPSPKIQTPKQRSRQGEQIADSAGIASTGIIVSEDYNNKLIGTSRIKVYDQMRLGDGTARAMTQIMKLPIRAANWRVEPASENRKDTKIAEFIDKQLFENETRTWDQIMVDALVYLDYGSIPMEIVYKFFLEGEQTMIGLHKLARIRPDTIQSWKLQNGDDGIQQFTVNGNFNIPMDKMVVFINEREGENWEGISIFRYAYKHWYMKDKIYLIDAIAHERQGLGVPFGKLPPGANDADEAKMDEILQNMRANENAYMRYPEGWEVGFLDMKSGSTRNPKDTIAHHDREMTKSILAQFIDLGSNGGGGSHALGKDQSSFFLMSLEAIAKNIRDTFNRFLIKKLVDLNFDIEDGEYPELAYDAIGEKDVKAFTASLQQVIQTGIVVPDDKLERHVREVMDLPESEGETPDPSMADEGDAEIEAEMAEVEALMNDEETEAEIPEEVDPEDVTASYKKMSSPDFIASYGEEVLGIMKAARRPTSDETKKKISEALKRFWDTKGRSTKGKGKGRKKANPEIKAKRKAARVLRQELRDFNDDNKRKLLEMKAKGEKLSEQDKAKRDLALFDKRKSLRTKISKLKAEIEDIKDAEKAKAEVSKPAPKEAKEPSNDILLGMAENVGKVVKAVEDDISRNSKLSSELEAEKLKVAKKEKKLDKSLKELEGAL